MKFKKKVVGLGQHNESQIGFKLPTFRRLFRLFQGYKQTNGSVNILLTNNYSINTDMGVL